MMAAHESPRTTKLYDRTSDQLSLDEVERVVLLIASRYNYWHHLCHYEAIYRFWERCVSVLKMRLTPRVKENWQQFRKSKPGHRFQDRYDHRQKATQGQWNIGKLFNIVGGIAIALAGLFLVPLPGPGWVIIFVGLGLLGREFLPVARSLDWVEVRLRGLAQQAKAIWMRSSIPMKILITLIILGCAAAIGYGSLPPTF
jgi:uncharacterized protein (TIGR02611 family)